MKDAIEYYDKPCAAKGLDSYRYKGPFGWIMIGARSNLEALSEANRSLSLKNATIENLQVWDGDSYKNVLNVTHH